MAADTSVKGLFGDKRVQLAAAGVAGLGLVVLLMRRGGAPSGAAGQPVIQPAAGLDSTSSDLYNAMQQLGQGWEQDIRDLTGSLNNVNDKLSKTPTGSRPTTGGVYHILPTPYPIVPPASRPKPAVPSSSRSGAGFGVN